MRKITYSKLRIFKFKKIISRSLFGELQLKQISLNFKNFRCNLKIRGLGGKRVWFYYCFNFERYDNLKSRSQIESKSKNPTHIFNMGFWRDEPCASAHIRTAN